MISADAEHPNCAYAWMDHIICPEANAQSPSGSVRRRPTAKACDLTTRGLLRHLPRGDEAYAEQIHYWTTPIEQCLDGRTDVKCTTYQEWTQAWTEIKG